MCTKPFTIRADIDEQSAGYVIIVFYEHDKHKIYGGFFEWEPIEGRRKQPWLFRVADGSPMSIAGLWEHWEGGADGQVIESCTVLTTGANELMAQIHIACLSSYPTLTKWGSGWMWGVARDQLPTCCGHARVSTW